MAQLSEMLSAVNQHWNINDLKRVYPHLSRKPRSRHQAECVKQISLHFAEACERLAEACEEVGHGNVRCNVFLLVRCSLPTCWGAAIATSSFCLRNG